MIYLTFDKTKIDVIICYSENVDIHSMSCGKSIFRFSSVINSGNDLNISTKSNLLTINF